MKLFKTFKTATAAALILSSAYSLNAQAEAVSVDQLLNLVEKGQARDNEVFRDRLKTFNDSRAQQERLLTQAQNERAKLEELSSKKEQQFRDQEQDIASAQQKLTDRMGGLKELFGVLQQVAGDTKAVFEGSLISSQISGREAFLTDLIKVAGSSSQLPSIENLERLWFEMQREATLSGQIAKYTSDVVLPTGETVTQEIIRVGSFNAINDGNYLNWDLETKRLVQLDKQPSGRYVSPVSELFASQDEVNPFWIDPSRGQLLQIMGQTPNLNDRIDQGGIVGYIILALGAVGVLIAIWRMLILYGEKARVKNQMASNSADSNNALGRVMVAFEENKTADTETLELHLGEAIATELPRLMRGIGWIKIISVVAPLLGLLGTVTGMIDVFETMSLFGTGDPKLMAGGISQALITTVLGLVAAIPCVFLHTLTSNRSRELIMILEERATGILARQSEASSQKVA